MSQVEWGAKPTAKKSTSAAPDLDKLVAGKGGIKRLNANIPEDTHMRFKIAVARQKLDMTTILTSLIEDGLKNQPG